MTQEEILLATLTTDSNGEATYTYTGVGAGKIDLMAKYRSLQSEIYEVLDCTFYDPLTSDTGKFTGSNDTRTFGANGCVVEQSGTGNSTFTYFPSSNLHSLTGSKSIRFDINTVNNVALRLYDNGANPRQIGTLENYTGEWHDVDIRFDSTTSKASLYIDGEYVTQVDLSSYNMTTYGFNIVDWQSDINLTIKNFKIYPI